MQTYDDGSGKTFIINPKGDIHTSHNYLKVILIPTSMLNEYHDELKNSNIIR